MENKQNTLTKLTVRIPNADSTDADRLITAFNKMGGESDFLTYGADEFFLNTEQTIAFIDGKIKNYNELILFAEVEGELAGAVSLMSAQRERLKHKTELGIAVLKEYWGKGIGRKLMEDAIDYAQGCSMLKKINLNVRRDNVRAVGLYKNLGFAVEGILSRDHYTEGKYHDCLLMGLLLD